MEILPEEWRPVIGREGQYEVSNLGRVRSLDRVVACRDGRQKNYRGRILSCNVSTAIGPGYPMVNVGGGTRYVHNIVLEAFAGPRPPGHEACHKNGVRTDNRAENLRWGTPQSNQNDRARHGTSNRGERCAAVKLTAAQVVAIRISKERGCDLAKRYGVSQQTICCIRKGRNWRHLQEAT